MTADEDDALKMMDEIMRRLGSNADSGRKIVCRPITPEVILEMVVSWSVDDLVYLTHSLVELIANKTVSRVVANEKR